MARSRLGMILSLFVVSVTACSGPIRPEGDRRMHQVKDRIVFVSEWNGKEEIFDMDSDGGGLRRLTTTKGGTGSWQPAWSPDSARNAFASDRNHKSSRLQGVVIWVPLPQSVAARDSEAPPV